MCACVPVTGVFPDTAGSQSGEFFFRFSTIYPVTLAPPSLAGRDQDKSIEFFPISSTFGRPGLSAVAVKIEWN